MNVLNWFRRKNNLKPRLEVVVHENGNLTVYCFWPDGVADEELATLVIGMAVTSCSDAMLQALPRSVRAEAARTGRDRLAGLIIAGLKDHLEAKAKATAPPKRTGPLVRPRDVFSPRNDTVPHHQTCPHHGE